MNILTINPYINNYYHKVSFGLGSNPMLINEDRFGYYNNSNSLNGQNSRFDTDDVDEPNFDYISSDTIIPMEYLEPIQGSVRNMDSFAGAVYRYTDNNGPGKEMEIATYCRINGRTVLKNSNGIRCLKLDDKDLPLSMRGNGTYFLDLRNGVLYKYNSRGNSIPQNNPAASAGVNETETVQRRGYIESSRNTGRRYNPDDYDFYDDFPPDLRRGESEEEYAQRTGWTSFEGTYYDNYGPNENADIIDEKDFSNTGKPLINPNSRRGTGYDLFNHGATVSMADLVTMPIERFEKSKAKYYALNLEKLGQFHEKEIAESFRRFDERNIVKNGAGHYCFPLRSHEIPEDMREDAYFVDLNNGKIYEYIGDFYNNYVSAEPIPENTVNPAANTAKSSDKNTVEQILIAGLPLERLERELASTDNVIKNSALDDLTEYIKSDKFNPTLKDAFGRNVIHLSMLSRDERIKNIIAKAMGKGVDLNSQNCVGQTPLMQAIKNFITAKNEDEKSVDLSNIKFILEQNPNIDIQDKNGQTAFHLACLSTSAALLVLLLKKNPNVLLKDIQGKRAAEYLKTDAMKDVYQKYIMG